MNIFRIVYLLLLKATTKAVKAAVDKGIVFHPQTSQLDLLGSYLILNCSFDIEDDPDRIRVTWLMGKTQHSDCQGLDKLSSGLANQTADLGTRAQVTQWTRHDWSLLTLRDITANDSGWYFCQVLVEIPQFMQSCSSGIEVIITSSPERFASTGPTAKQITSPSSATFSHVSVHWWVWATVSIGSLLLFAVLRGIWILYRRKKYQNEENPIYEDMHRACNRIDSPQPSPCPRTQLNPSYLPSSVHPGTPKIL